MAWTNEEIEEFEKGICKRCEDTMAVQSGLCGSCNDDLAHS